jgi:hypothetical protein
LRYQAIRGFSDHSRVSLWIYCTKLYRVKKLNTRHFYELVSSSVPAKHKYNEEIVIDLKRTFQDRKEF